MLLKDVLAWIRKEFNGFLNLIECYPDLFAVGVNNGFYEQVERIPSNDYVHLIASFVYVMNMFPETKDYLDYAGFCSPSSCLHAGNLQRRTTKKALIDYFSPYAEVKSLRIKLFHGD